MLSSWFSSKSSSVSRQSRGLQTPPTRPPPEPKTQVVGTDLHSVRKPSQSLSTLEPSTTISPSSSKSAIPLSDFHAHIDDPSPYGTSSLYQLGPPPAETRGVKEDGDARGNIGNKRPRKGKEKATETVELPFTLQDATLAQVFRFPLPTAHDNPGAPAPAVSAVSSAQTTPLDGGSESIPRPSSTAGGSTSPLSLPLFDPYTGARIGEHPPPTGAGDQAQPWAKSPLLPATGDSDIWPHVARILELQAEVAGMHAEMEGVGSAGRGGAGGGATGAGGVGAGLGASSDARPQTVGLSSTKRPLRGEMISVGDDDEPPSGISMGAGGGLIDTSSEDEDADDPEKSAKKKREEEFARLAEQFAERKVAIGRIMDKLDVLSDALKTFHALPIPVMDLRSTAASRTNTLSSVTSGHSVPSPPQHPARSFQPATSGGAHATLFTKPSTSSARPAENLIHDAPDVDSPVDMDIGRPTS